MGSTVAIIIRKATLHDMDAVLECLHTAFAPYEATTPESRSRIRQ